MRDISNKADNVGDTLPAEDFNAMKNEQQNFVESTYQTLDGEGGPDTDLNMQGKAVSLVAGAGDFYADSGAANAYVLTRSTTIKAIPSYRDGLRISFIAGNTNSGASTVNVSTLGVKNITLPDGTALTGGEIIAGNYIECRYDLSNDRFHIVVATIALPKGYIDGLILSNEAGDTDHDIEVSPGVCRSDANDLDMAITTAWIKQIDVVWAVGTGNGGRASGVALSVDTWYHFFEIGKADGSAVDFGFDTDVDAVNLLADASGYTSYRRLGSVLTDGSSNILGFIQTGGDFRFNLRITDYSAAAAATSRQTVTLTVPIDVPIMAKIKLSYQDASITHLRLFEVGETDVSPTTNALDDLTADTNSQVVSTEMEIKTDTSAQIQYRTDAVGNLITIVSKGWRDYRGKDA